MATFLAGGVVVLREVLLASICCFAKASAAALAANACAYL